MSHPEQPTALTTHHPAALTPYEPTMTAIELSQDRGPVVWVPDAYGRMVPMPKHLAPPPMPMPEPRDLTPLPLLDPIAQRLLAAGIGGGALAAGVGYGAAEVIDAATGFGSGVVFWLAVILLALRAPSRAVTQGAGTTVNIRKAVIKRSHFYG
ncbi:hypothetical protein A6P39_029660 [Streptomyces sp. FXJ1.172]|uniref:hypothetical protein n=1 Tax=Streptomyces sp. FXJ1.172 TaxID=710705 RepID=UPI0007CF5514|nr:hypothetical protein [Streptomyces sp. FXJ1.172]WEO97852.1 hypothetical protein A6P39_029660 [Streptomyces sp. FXJ1.172]